MKTPLSGPSRALRRLAVAVGLAMAGVAVLALMAILGFVAAAFGGPLLVQLLER